MERVALVAAARTAIGDLGGALSMVPAHVLGQTVLEALLTRSGVEPKAVEETILGQVLVAGQGQNPARQAHLAAGLRPEASAWGVSQVCGSGLRAIMIAAQQIQLGAAQIIAAGGQESMSLAPHLVALRGQKSKIGHMNFVDSMLHDGLRDALTGDPMGLRGEHIAKTWKISRAEQDDFAWASHDKASAAERAGKFAPEIVPVQVAQRRGSCAFERDEHIRSALNRMTLTALKPVFAAEGTVTAANASGLNDGAAAVLLMSETEVQRRGLTPLGYIAGAGTAGVAPHLMGIAPVAASRKALAAAKWSVSDLDLIESNEAFAAQAIAVSREMGWPASKVNVNGGAIAVGHPIGASGARIVTTLLYEMQRRGAHKGLATLCIGGGMGVALCVERP